MSKNPLDQLLADIAAGVAELPEAGAGKAIGDDHNLWPVGVGADGTEWCYTSGAISRQVRTEDTGRDLRPAGTSFGIVSLEVLPPVELVEVEDPATGELVWMEVTA
ncbi:hypothetical protein [Nocardia flavorosea]|uniref:hypothetical protein n=1 Tax=Nocardia flavorosea TaxID=53429 RepID=UPI002458892D|nr:hypothetical protein [Nocardia flavorosea]